MASYDQNKSSGLWSVRFRAIETGVEKNKRLSGFRTKKDAQQAYIDFMKSYVPDNASAGNLFFEDVFKKYQLEIKPNNKDSTQVDKQEVFINHILPFFNSKKIKEIDKKCLVNFQTMLWNEKQKNGQPYAYKYLTKIRGFLNHFLNWIYFTYGIPNILPSIKLPKDMGIKKEMQIWEQSDFEKFMQCSKDDMLYHTFTMFQFYTGNRLGETLALGECDVKDGKVNISKSLSHKTLDDSKFKISATKNYKTRKTPIPKILQEQLEKYLQWKRENNITSEFLFCGENPISEKTVKRRMGRYAKQAGIKTIRIHDLRHSYVSLLIHLGISTKVIAELIGDTEEQVIKTYSHMYSNDKNVAINAINNVVLHKEVEIEGDWEEEELIIDTEKQIFKKYSHLNSDEKKQVCT